MLNALRYRAHFPIFQNFQKYVLVRTYDRLLSIYFEGNDLELSTRLYVMSQREELLNVWGKKLTRLRVVVKVVEMILSIDFIRLMRSLD